MHVIIVGAGLGGLCLAQCLRKQGISFEIFERDQDENSRFQGWAIAFRGAIIDDFVTSFPSDMPDLREATNHLAPLTLPAQICMYPPGMQGRVGVEDSPETPVIRAERFRLRRWLMANIPVQWDKHVMSIEHGDEDITVRFNDGASTKGDLVIGADGINSIVREHLLKRPSSSLLNVVPLAAIAGQVTLSGDAFIRQLELGHSGYMVMNPTQGFFSFCGLHHALADGASGRHYWVLMQPDNDISEPNHWLQSASQQEKLDHVLKLVKSGLSPRHRELFELTPVEGIKDVPHIWRDLELDVDDVSPGPVILLGDAAHAMMPFRGEGGHHALVDALNLSKLLEQLNHNFDGARDTKALNDAVAAYNSEMLARGVEAVRNSRTMKPPQKRGDGKSTEQEGLKLLPEKRVTLESHAKYGGVALASSA